MQTNSNGVFLLNYAIFTQDINTCAIKTGYIRLHVSAVARPTRKIVNQGTFTSFSNGIPLFTLNFFYDGRATAETCIRM